MKPPLDVVAARCGILASLVNLKRSGAIDGLWCTDVERSIGPLVQIGRPAFDDFDTGTERLTWDEAAALVARLAVKKLERKPAGRETLAEIKKGTRKR